jgi:hypothetical protein
LFGRRSAVEVTGLLAIAAPFFIVPFVPFVLSCSLHTALHSSVPPMSLCGIFCFVFVVSHQSGFSPWALPEPYLGIIGEPYCCIIDGILRL